MIEFNGCSVMDLDFFLEILGIRSTSGTEAALAGFLADNLQGPGCEVHRHDVGDGTSNLLFDWSGTGAPPFVFCTHMDTVPPYIRPKVVCVKEGDTLPGGAVAAADDTMVMGRGSCDAKGQLISMYEACRTLAREGYSDFGLLLLSGEETGSKGAKAYTRDCPGGDFVLVGEPTDNCLISESKGTKAFTITLPGKPCHSGYPEKGVSAVERFVEFMNLLKIADFPKDRVLGDTTWNVGMLKSGNPRNILSPEITFDIYFRTTFATDDLVHNKLLGICGAGAVIRAFGGDSPMCFFSDVEGIPVKTASFGSDAPHLAGFRRKAVCGPGSILTAHTPDEHVLLSDLDKAVEQDIAIYKEATGKNRLA